QVARRGNRDSRTVVPALESGREIRVGGVVVTDRGHDFDGGQSMRILLITGPAGQAQGWGNLETTMRIRDALDSMGMHTSVFFVETAEALIERLKTRTFDLVWSALYYISSNADFIGHNASGLWVHDILDRMAIPYLGS